MKIIVIVGIGVLTLIVIALIYLAYQSYRSPSLIGKGYDKIMQEKSATLENEKSN